LVFRYGFDPKMFCLCRVAQALWFLGYPDRALQTSQAAVAWAREWAYPMGLAAALPFAAFLHQYRREVLLVQERAETAMTLSREQGFVYTLAQSTILRGWTLAEQKQAEEGITQIYQGQAALKATGGKLGQSMYLTLLADAYGKTGQEEAGLAVLAEALETVARTSEGLQEAELYRLKGQLALQKLSAVSSQLSVPNPQPLTPSTQAEAEAEACFLKAIEIARKQQAKSWELRASVSLARLWQQQGKTREAHQMLSEIYGWFTEGFDTKDLQEAKMLLEELA
jgi:predicted ATPase